MSSSSRAGASILRHILRKNRGKLVASALLLSCWTAGEALVPAVVGTTIDSAIASPDAVRLALWLLALVGTFVMLSYGYRWGARLSNGVLQHETHRLRTLIADRALDPRGSVHARPAGEIAALASSDAEVAGASVRQVALGISAALGLLVCSAYLLLTQWQLGLLVLILVPLGLVLLRTLTPALTRRTGEHQATVARASGSVADLLHGAPVLRGVGAEREAAAWFAGRSQAAVRAAVRAAGPSGRLDAFSVAVSGLILAAVAGVGGWLAVDGQLTPGDLIGVMGVTAFLSTPITGLVTLAEGWARSRAAADRLAAFLAEPALRTGTATPAEDPGADLTLEWNPAEGGAPVRIDAPGGDFTAIVCADAGLPARWDESLHRSDGQSAITVQGVPWSDIDPAHAPRVLQPAPHAPHLFRGTVLHNVLPEGPVDPSVWEASGVGDLLEGWADGENHALHEDGANLSGGQRQRLVLARSLASRPVPRLLLDPTTAVDSVTEARIADGLRAWRARAGRGATLAVFTSSPAMAGAADRVAFVRSTGATIYGHHHALLERADYREAVGR